MSNDFSTDDCVDEGICLDSANNADRMLKPKVYFLPAHYLEIDYSSSFVSCPLDGIFFVFDQTVAFQQLLKILVTICSIVGRFTTKATFKSLLGNLPIYTHLRSHDHFHQMRFCIYYLPIFYLLLFWILRVCRRLNCSLLWSILGALLVVITMPTSNPSVMASGTVSMINMLAR